MRPNAYALPLVSETTFRDGNGGKSKSLKVGVRGLCPLKLKGFFFLLNLRYEKPHFLKLYPVSNNHSKSGV